MAKTKSRTSRQKKAENKDGSMLEDFFIDSLKDIYWAEKALTKALPRMSKATTSSELKSVFDQHLEDGALNLGLNLVHDFHRFDDAEDLSLGNTVTH